MAQLSFQQFLLRQPSYPEQQPTDRYYYDLCCRLIDTAVQSRLLETYHTSVIERACLALTGYYQDVICDAGLWRSFIDRNRAMYRRTLPFFEVGDDYMDYELNFADVQFMLWYATSMYSDKQRRTYPLDCNIRQLAQMLYEILESEYDNAPMPEGYVFGRELEMHDPGDQETLFSLGNWLFMHSWLLTPAYALTLSGILNRPETKGGDIEAIREALEQSMSEHPTGPLALHLSHWVSLVAEGKLPRQPRRQPSDEEKPRHPYYDSFIAANDGSPIRFISGYDDLNSFLIDALGWDKEEKHLPQLQNDKDFVLLVNPDKGMLVARNVSRCIAAPQNSSYDRQYARQHAIDLLTVRGLCPRDLLVYCLDNGWLPDATFPGSDDTRLVADNADFIARCYLQHYYTAD